MRTLLTVKVPGQSFNWRRAAYYIAMIALTGGALAPAVVSAQPVTSDSRIKTFVYNPNEVFSITTHYGYQSNIEFGPKEVIDTISVGDRVAWQVIPAGRRLFIRAMEENARTNMTIVTNQRAYQFDLRSSSANAVFGSEELTYVVRFFYPGEAVAGGAVYVPPVMNTPVARDLPPPAPAATTAKPTAAAKIPAPAQIPAPMPSPLPQVSAAPPAPAPMPASAPMNYRYTFSGPNDLAPTKIYDDGKTTYFKLPPSAMPKFAILTARGETVDVSSRRTQDGLFAVDAVAPRFRLNQSGSEVIVYNESGNEVR